MQIDAGKAQPVQGWCGAQILWVYSCLSGPGEGAAQSEECCIIIAHAHAQAYADSSATGTLQGCSAQAANATTPTAASQRTNSCYQRLPSTHPPTQPPGHPPDEDDGRRSGAGLQAGRQAGAARQAGGLCVQDENAIDWPGSSCCALPQPAHNQRR